jgi:putative inorganic carbon (HCO3(-)) transporter
MLDGAAGRAGPFVEPGGAAVTFGGVPATTRPRPLALPSRHARPRAGPWHIAALAAGAAVLVGALLAREVTLGIGLLVACAYVPLVLINLPLGIALWIPLVAIEYSRIASFGPFAALVLLAVAWVGAGPARAFRGETAKHTRRALLVLGALVLWVWLSVVWAADAGVAAKAARAWLIAGAAFVLVATTMTTPQRLRWVAIAFAVGGVVSILVGLSGAGVSTSASAIDLATQSRFAGGAGDANFLAAGLVACTALAAGLLGIVRDIAGRLVLVLVTTGLFAALAATESRGGLIAAGVCLVASLVLLRGRRVQVACFVVVALAGAAVVFATSPAALERVTSFDAGGSGRSDLWTVAWRMTEDHPLIGVGLSNFQTHAPDYVRRPGSLEFVELIVDRPHVVHNLYLQQLAETGIVGLALLLAAMTACITAALGAARRFEAAGDAGMGSFARAAAIAMIGFLSASFFISDATDKRLWMTLAIGPALAGAARNLTPSGPLSEAAPPPPGTGPPSAAPSAAP